VGTFDWPAIAILVAYGEPRALAASYTLVLHVALWLPITLLGAYYYFRQPLRWGPGRQQLRAAPEAAPGPAPVDPAVVAEEKEKTGLSI
jgi:hypothetical protein